MLANTAQARSEERMMPVRRSVYNPRKATSTMSILTSVTKWETDMKHLKEVTNEELTDGAKRSILTDICPHEYGGHLRKNMGQFKTYADLKQELMNYIERVQPNPHDVRGNGGGVQGHKCNKYGRAQR